MAVRSRGQERPCECTSFAGVPRPTKKMINVTQKRNPKAPRQIPQMADPGVRCNGWKEVTNGFTLEQAGTEARRCLNCKDPKCVQACPIHIDIKTYIAKLVNAD